MQTTQSTQKSLVAVEQKVMALEQSMAEMRQSMAEMKAERAMAPPKAPKKQRAPKAESGVPKEKKPPSEWNLFTTSTVAEMRQSGWQSFTSAEGVVWPRSRVGVVKNKKGEESEQYVYDGGIHDGKPPSPALGGMVRASYLKTQSNPDHKAKALAYRAELSDKRSVGSGSVSAPASGLDGEAPKKKGRGKMTDEQKAAAKVKREAKKAAAAAPAVLVEPEEEFAEAEEEAEAEAEEEAKTPLPSPSVGGGGSAPAPAVKKAVVLKRAPKKLDLTFKAWSFQSEKYYKNERGDLINANSEWVGRFDSSANTIDESIEQPDDLEDAFGKLADLLEDA